MIERIQPADFPPPAVPLSYGARAGEFLFVSGQTARSADGEVFIGDFDREVRLALDNVEAVLRAAGAAANQLVKINAYLSSAALFGPFNDVYRARFADAPPARTTLVVGFGNPNVRVEIEAVAYLG